MQSFWQARAQNYPAFPHDNGPALSPIDMPFNFLDNHDLPRFLFASDTATLATALTFLYTWDGIPCLYYGDEIGLQGKVEHGSDRAVRQPMPVA